MHVCFISLPCIYNIVSLLVWHQSYFSSSPTTNWCTCSTSKHSWTSLSLTCIISCCISISNISTASIPCSHLPLKLSNLFDNTYNCSIITRSRGLIWGVLSWKEVDFLWYDHFLLTTTLDLTKVTVEIFPYILTIDSLSCKGTLTMIAILVIKPPKCRLFFFVR